MLELSKLELQALKALQELEAKYAKEVELALAEALNSMRGEMARIYKKYAKNGKLTRAEMTKYNKYQTMERDLLKYLDPAITANIKSVKKLLPEMYNESFFHYAWAIDQA